MAQPGRLPPRLDAATTLWSNWKNSSLLSPPPARTEPGALPQYAGLTSAQDLAARQEAADRQRESVAQRSSMAGLTLRTALQDLREVVVGIPTDLFGGSGTLPLGEVVVKNDRLRGLGLLLLVTAVLAAALL